MNLSAKPYAFVFAYPWAALIALSIFGVITHLIPHDMGISTVGVVGMLAAAYLPRKLVILPVFLTLVIVDAINGFYALLALSFVYIGHVLAALSVSPILKSIQLKTLCGASIISAVVFYLVSNITPMVMGYYPTTIEGWVTCYVNGLPFLIRGIFANLIFGAVLFGAIHFVRESHAYRIALTQRN